MPAPYDLTREQLAVLLGDEPAYRSRQVWEGLHARVQRPEEMTELPATLRETLAAALPPALREISRRVADGGQTTKWLWVLDDDARVETVLMHYPDRVTVCVSTQAGCAMACQFCATGQAGFHRHLTEGEIVEQVAVAMREARPRRLSNVVFMGMGEPLANYDRVWGAVVRLHRDMGLSARHLTLSTVGLVPGIRRLATETLPVNLAVSLHAANDALRDVLVPINRRYPLAAVAEACAEYVAASGRRLSIEWALIDGVNDRDSDAAELADFSRPAWRPRQSHPPQPDTRLSRGGVTAGSGAAFPGQAGRAGGQRHDPRHSGSRYRCRLRTAGGRGARADDRGGDAGIRPRPAGSRRPGSLEHGRGTDQTIGRRAARVAVVPRARRRDRDPDQAGSEQRRLRARGRNDGGRAPAPRGVAGDAGGDRPDPCH